MPLIMDHGINMDDLFGESGSFELGLSPATPKGLAQRLDEMRLLGCCQYVIPVCIDLCMNPLTSIEKLLGHGSGVSRTSPETA